MAKAELKTRPDKGSAKAFLDVVSDPQVRKDCLALSPLMRKVTGKAPKTRASIVGFGSYHRTHESRREGEWMLAGSSPRKQSMKRLEDIDLPTPGRNLEASVRATS